MRRASSVFALLLALTLALTPALAMARAGAGYSMGSRGSRTYSAPSGAAPFQRSTTVPGSNYANGGYGGGGYGYRRSGFGSGLMGGLLGFGLGSMLFGRGGFGGGGLGIIGLLIRLAIIFFLVRWAFRWFARRSGGGGGFSQPNAYPTQAYGQQPLFGAPQAPPLAGPPVVIQPADYNAFEILLKNIQAAWSNSDLNALREYASPEMVSYFAEQLANNASRGVRNVVSNVQLQKGDLSEAWHEDGRTYATVTMNFSMTDATYDQSGQVVDGSATEHVSAHEFWTFLRADGGRWMLSAIQQGR
jgi:predicted lipid-binding transport protein (Tim44 family)